MASNTDSVAVLIPGEHIAKVIGKAGAGLKQIREATGCKVQVQQSPETNAVGGRRTDISGTADQIAAAFQLIVNKAFSEATSTPMLLIPAEKAGQVVGKGGDNLKKVREECHVRCSVEREPVVDPTTGQQERMLTMSGEVAQMARALRTLLGSPMTAYMGALAAAPAVAGLPVPMAIAMSGGIRAVMPSGPSQVKPPSSDPDELQLHFTVPDKLAGAILGKAGAQVKQTAATSGCKVSMTNRDAGERRAVIMGTFSQCATAQGLLNDQLAEASRAAGQELSEVSVIYLIRKEAAGAVIGKQGATLKQIRESSGAKIQLARDEVEGQRPCTLTGPLHAVMQAEKMIWEVTRTVEMPIEEGKGGMASITGGGAYSNGWAPSMNEDAGTFPPTAKRQRVDDGEIVTKILVPAQSAGAVIGKQGSGLKEIRETTGAHVDMLQQAQAPQWPADRMVILKGSVGARQAGVSAILRNAYQMFGDTCTLKMLVTSQQAGSVIGKQGSTLKRIREQTGISVQVEREEVFGDRLVAASGTHPQVATAAGAILAILEHQGPLDELPTIQDGPSPAYCGYSLQSVTTAGEYIQPGADTSGHLY